MLHLKNKLRLLPLLQLLLKKLQITLKQLLKKLLPFRRLRKDIQMLFYLLKKLLIMPIMLLIV